jgi:cation diffusion facilitator CzcD-associated flavoprotein CzcO
VFSQQAEILDKLQSFAERRALRPHIRFNTEVTSARWDEARSCWLVATKDGGEIAATVLISAWGQLNRWQLPDIPGRDSFQGTAFHSSDWRHNVALEGKRVACIGSGASAIQIIPEIARQARHLTVFQRSAPYVVPRMDRAYTPEERELFASDSNAFSADREAIYTEFEARYSAMRPGSPKWQEFTAISRAYLEAQVSDRVLREKLWPDYPLGCKRVLLSDDFYPAMTLPHVELVTERIAGIEPLGIRTADGRLHELDVIVYATGFETLSFLSGTDIKGRDRRSLREEWHDGARAYYGMAVAGFPNFFMICGPNTFLGHNSVIAMLECQLDYILQALRLMRERQASALAVRPDAMQRFDHEVQRRLQGSAWAGGCTSWYKNPSGRITNNWCGSVEDYKRETARLEVADFELAPAAELASGIVSELRDHARQPLTDFKRFSAWVLKEMLVAAQASGGFCK